MTTLYDNACGDVAIVTNPIKREYSRRHGYDCLLSCGHTPQPRGVIFARYRWYLNLLRSNRWDWLMCCDADVLITNMRIPLESLIAGDLTIARDARMIQAGVFLIRNSANGISIIRQIIEAEPEYCTSPHHDQSAMEVILPQYNGAVRIVPQRRLQSYEYGLYRSLGGNYAAAVDCDGNDGQWQAGDFALHVPGDISGIAGQKPKILKEHIPLIVR